MNRMQKCLLTLAFVLPVQLGAQGLETLVEECNSCHGPDGVSGHADVPTIAGQSAEYLARNLRVYQDWGRPCVKSAYRYGDTSRPHSDMCQVTADLSDEQFDALASYYAAKDFQPAPQEFDAALAEVGAGLHEQHCENCHAEGGRAANRVPRLAGQWIPYLRKSLSYVPTGEHLVPRTMETTIAEFNAEEIDALMHFFASQQD
ncbi:MAG: c-type cytochrome [Xanthomonadales bacterium]|nr:c-type cytochrome [Xanthomonadales bacterium]